MREIVIWQFRGIFESVIGARALFTASSHSLVMFSSFHSQTES